MNLCQTWKWKNETCETFAIYKNLENGNMKSWSYADMNYPQQTYDNINI